MNDRALHSTSDPFLEQAQGSVQLAKAYLLETQHEDGHWCGELQGDAILESEYILLLAWLGQHHSDLAHGAATYLLKQQEAHGGWSLYPGGELEISSSVKAYFALKLTGHDIDSAPMRRARAAILQHGGADRVNSFTRFYLALLGQISYDHCPAIPPEFVLLPNWAPINIYRISAWSRTIFVPLSIMWAHRPQCSLHGHEGIRELFVTAPEHWPRLQSPGHVEASGRRWQEFFYRFDRLLKWCEKRKLHFLRRRALRAAECWMVDRFEDSDGLGAIFPPIVWSLVALKCLGYADESNEVRYCHDQLKSLMIKEHETIRLQPCKSPVWDTAIALRALHSGGEPPESAAAEKPKDWLLKKEVRHRGDWSKTLHSPAGGWYFEYRNKFYPDVDDTIMVMMALRGAIAPKNTSPPNPHLAPAVSAHDSGVAAREKIADACERGRRWVLAMQNRDGGWGAFDRNNNAEFLCHVPFADHNAMIDPSTADITGRVIEALGQWGMTSSDPPVQKALSYLRKEQEDDGSWIGRWGVNYIYGTWQVLAGLAEVGIATSDTMVQRGSEWLLQHQQESGAWGESPGTYDAPMTRGSGPPTASQTAWAILGLIAAGHAQHDAVRKGIRFLTSKQRADGAWHESEFTGTGFPNVFYLRYHMYPIYFPMLALGHWIQAVQRADEAPSHVHTSRIVAA